MMASVCVCVRERDFQAILFFRIILPEHTAETGERQITCNGVQAISPTHTNLYKHTHARMSTLKKIRPRDVTAKCTCEQHKVTQAALPHDLHLRTEMFDGQYNWSLK